MAARSFNPRLWRLVVGSLVAGGGVLGWLLGGQGVAPWLFLVVMLATAVLVALLVGPGLGRSIDRRLHHPLESAKQRAEQELAAAHREAERLRAERDDLARRSKAENERRLESHRELVANVSHELKTPLTSIRGYAETLADGALEDTATARRFTRRILEQCERLEALIRDLLTLSRLDARPARRARPFDLVALARHALETLAPQAEQGEIDLVLEVNDPPPPRLAADPDDVERLLLNLVENAIKYNRSRGSVQLVLAGEEDWVRIEVRDTGIGIPQHDLERIFERFYRVDKGRTRSQGGTGLGLSIVAELVYGLGGEVSVESRLGHGSVFRVDLPAALPEQVRGATHEGGDSSGRSIVTSSTE